MSPRITFAWCVAALCGASLAQTRTLSQSSPPILGWTTIFTLDYSNDGFGNPYAFLWCVPPYQGTYPLSVPGFTVNGPVLVDPATSVAAFSGVLPFTGQVGAYLQVPAHPSFVGYAWDLQTVDLDMANLALNFSTNELSVAISATPPSNMVPIPPGVFAMGSNASSSAPYYSQLDEKPVHQVHITRPFWIGRHEVTQGEYQALMGSNPSRFQGASYPNSANRPVEQVTWANAVAYCVALTAQEAAAGRLPSGYQYRLPTEAEWEYCCRAGTTTEYWIGTAVTCTQARFLSIYYNTPACGSTSTEVVGTYLSNNWGLYDVGGNVFELCYDGWDGTANYPSGDVYDPYVTYVPVGAMSHVARGGSWGAYGFSMRSADRFWLTPASSYSSGIGFRVVLGPILP